MSNKCKHNWDQSSDLAIIEESDSYMIWEETEYCDLCFKVRVTEFRADKDINDNLSNIRRISELIRVQTEAERRNATTQ